ncbi:hypothetical protein HDE68_000451 [Pedobacter cryoconitis]|uniref:Uncharacterized protein n=1 Tax=Pedobacter cryoconitis TaxID=188932 RepID=A0A7W9DX55_9SPHI|nr:hypothetical protein [Pedobacter cryoconitis]MBB5634566.1 hypothetical protein [Pedobacter cryoconitis]
MEIVPDPACLPDDKQHIQFQIIIEELYGKWRTGYYNSIEQAVYEHVTDDNGKEKVIIHDIVADVVRWLPINEQRPAHWRNIIAREQKVISIWSALHNKKNINS